MDISEQLIELQKLLLQVDRAKMFMPTSETQSNSTVNVNAGGPAVWACATLCAMSFLLCGFTLYIVTDLKTNDFSRIEQNDRDQGNQLNAIYMMAPHLKPEKKK